MAIRVVLGEDVTDIRMPPTSTDEGIRLARAARERQPEIGVVVLSQHASPAYAISLLEEGSAGRAYLLKERLGDVDELLHAMKLDLTYEQETNRRVMAVLRWLAAG